MHGQNSNRPVNDPDWIPAQSPVPFTTNCVRHLPPAQLRIATVIDVQVQINLGSQRSFRANEVKYLSTPTIPTIRQRWTMTIRTLRPPQKNELFLNFCHHDLVELRPA